MSSLTGFQISANPIKQPYSQVSHAIREADNTAVMLRSCLDKHSENQAARLHFMAQVLALFEHRNIVKLLDCIEDQQTPYLILEDIQGIDLELYAQGFEQQQVPVEQFMKIAIQLAEALSVIHHAQVIHKDLHPGNIVINPDSGQLQIIDFSSASLLSREQPDLATPDNFEGQLAYISPEQTGRMNRTLDYRSDFYSLGVIFYQLLTGKLPFDAEDDLGRVYAHMATQQVPANNLRPDLSEMISRIVDKLLSKNAQDRYQSALGLKHDLQHCLKALEENQEIAVFRLAQQDISGRFHLPQKLYGRDKEIRSLMQHFKQAAQGQPQMLRVVGYSGVGKSALVQELYKPVAAHQGIYISGKFDQYQQNQPYFALKAAIQNWLNQMLRLPEESIWQLRDDLLHSLGENARVLIDFMPEFELLFGVLPALPKLEALETQARFHLLFQRFIKTVTKHQPWVWFIDDIQWADWGTLHLLPELLSEGDCRLLIIVAYRDNEVGKDHAVTRMIQRIAANRGDTQSVTTLALGPLPESDISLLLADVLEQTPERLVFLAQLLHKKTAGNPFFLREFLSTLYKRGFLNFDLKTQQWTWDLAAIEREAITDNVLDLMISRMTWMPPGTQELLQLAACIGNHFDLPLLASIAGKTLSETGDLLWPAMQEGFLIQKNLNESSEQANSEDSEDLAKPIVIRQPPKNWQALRATRLSFLHDRVYQAAYESVSQAAREQTHLSIGRQLLKRLSAQERQKQVFDIVDHFNHSVALINNTEERLSLAELNSQAAEKAKLAGVWHDAAKFASIGRSLLADDTWQSHYHLSYALYYLDAECSYLSGHFDQAEALYKVLLEQTESDADKAEQCALRAAQYMGNSQYDKCMSLGRLALGFMHISLPKSKPEIKSYLAVQETHFQSILTGTPLSQFSQIEKVASRETEITTWLLSNLSVCAMLTGQHDLFTIFIREALILTAEQGKSDLSGITLANYGVYLAFREDFQGASEAGEQALAIKEQYAYCRQAAHLINGVCLSCHTLKYSLAEAIKLHWEGVNIGLARGETGRAAVNQSSVYFLLYMQGTPLDELLDHVESTLSLCHRHSLFPFSMPICLNYVHSLQQGENLLEDSAFDPQHLVVFKNSYALAVLKLYRLMFAFWNGQPLSRLLLLMHEAADCHHLVKGMNFSFEFYYIASLLIIRAIRKESQANCNKEDLQHLKLYRQKLESLYQLNPLNFEHQYRLVEAEYAALQQAPMKQVATLYEQAIKTAKGINHHEGLANEYYALYLQQQDLTLLVAPLLDQALLCYQRWGCQIKVKHLQAEHSFLKPVSSEVPTAQALSAKMDLSTIMKSAQAISGELALKGLAEQVMKVIMENTGAQRGAIIFKTQTGAQVEALVDHISGRSEYLGHQALQEEGELPISLISVTLRSGEVINLSDAFYLGDYTQDPYVLRTQAKSILCMPINYRDKRLGVLYLENKLSTAAFTEERLDVLQLLLAQTATSFENARLFNQITELNVGLEEQVTQRTAALNQAVKNLEQSNKELESFSFSVSHDLRAPLRTIKGFSEILLEDYLSDLDSDAQMMLKKVIAGAESMGELINGLLDLAQLQKLDIERQELNLSELAQRLINNLRQHEPARQIEVEIKQGMTVQGDPRMLHSALENLLSNAWKYSSKTEQAKISFASLEQNGQTVYYVRDNGAGFDMRLADKLFATFQRLHKEKDFSGTGVGLATVKRVIDKHGGEIWAEGEVGKGATFYFTLG